MEKSKAIQLLERLQDPDYFQIAGEACDAIQMAVDALSADGDTISRKAAIDVIDSFNVFESRSDQIKLEQMIGELPPAQPEIIRCKDCKHRDPEDKKCDCGHDIEWQLPRQDDWFCADGER